MKQVTKEDTQNLSLQAEAQPSSVDKAAKILLTVGTPISNTTTRKEEVTELEVSKGKICKSNAIAADCEPSKAGRTFIFH